jgi:hypothetical protein
MLEVHEETHVDLHVKWLLKIVQFKRKLKWLEIVHKILQYEMSSKSSHLPPNCFICTHRHMNEVSNLSRCSTQLRMT